MPAKPKQTKKPAKPKPEEAEKESQRGSTIDKVARDTEIFLGWLRGLSAASLSATFGVSESTVERALEQQKEVSRTAMEKEPSDIVRDLLLRYEGVVDQLAQVSATVDVKDHPSAVVSAIRERRETLTRIAELCQRAGLVPNDLGRIRHEFDVVIFVDAVLDVFNKRGVSDKIAQEVIDAAAQASGVNLERKALTTGAA